MTIKVYRDEDANAAILETSGDGSIGMRFNNELRAIGNGDGTFQPASELAVSSRPFEVKVVDADGDNVLDLMCANRDSHSVSVLLGNGDGTFQSPRNFGVGAGPLSVTAGDLNGDSILDLISANLHGNDLSVLIGLGFK